MKPDPTVSVLLAHCQSLQQAALQARGLLDRPAQAADALYQLRLTLRIFRILRPFVRKDPGYDELSEALNLCYRATSPLRDRQVGIGLIRQLETGWPRNRRRPSTALAQDLRQRYRQFGREMDVLQLDAALAQMVRAVERVERRVSAKKLRRRASEHAEALALRLSKRMHTALKRQRPRDWHQLRLAIKHYRFWVLALEDILPAEHGLQVKQLKPLQVALGDCHDWEVLSHWLAEVASAPLDDWLLALAAHKQADMQRAMSLLQPLLAHHGLVDIANGIS